jgi:Flp pilus assembly secretin CpaC
MNLVLPTAQIWMYKTADTVTYNGLTWVVSSVSADQSTVTVKFTTAPTLLSSQISLALWDEVSSLIWVSNVAVKNGTQAPY